MYAEFIMNLISMPRLASADFLIKPKMQISRQQKLGLTRVADHIYLGAIRLSAEYSLLKENNIKYVLNLTNSILQIDRNCDIVCLNQALNSEDFCSLMKLIPKCVSFIDKAIQEKKNIAICCRDGYSKTFVILAAYYILKSNQDYQTVYDDLKMSIPEFSYWSGTKYENSLHQMYNIIKGNNH